MTEKTRCAWLNITNQEYVDYHDQEWGVPVYEDRKLFEFLILEGAQAGLSWEMVLKRRKEYTKAFANFDWKKVAKFDQKKVEDILTNTGVIRNRLKVQGTVINAIKFQEIVDEHGSFSKYLWDFVEGKPIHNCFQSIRDIPAETEISKALSKDLKKRGFKFVGPTIMYAMMQAIGMVNDHTAECFLYKKTP